jgi:hypothetical protein
MCLFWSILLRLEVFPGSAVGIWAAIPKLHFSYFCFKIGVYIKQTASRKDPRGGVSPISQVKILRHNGAVQCHPVGNGIDD